MLIVVIVTDGHGEQRTGLLNVINMSKAPSSPLGFVLCRVEDSGDTYHSKIT